MGWAGVVKHYFFDCGRIKFVWPKNKTGLCLRKRIGLSRTNSWETG